MFVSIQPATERTHSHRKSAGGLPMFGTEKRLPILMCPGCEQPTQAIERRPVGFSNGFVDVTYVCETCVIHTTRTVKPGDTGLL